MSKTIEEITKEEFYNIWKENPNMKVHSSFTDIDGYAPYGVGRPAIDTTWGYDKEIVKTEQRKDFDYEEWEWKYYKFNQH